MVANVARVLVCGESVTAPGGLAPALRATPLLRGCEIETCGGNLAALHLVRERAFDVVLTDPATPLGADLALWHDFREARPGVRLIVLAPSAAQADVIAAARAEVFACFTAPFDVREVADMVVTALRDPAWREGIQVISAIPQWIQMRVSCRLVTAERLVRFMTELRSDLSADDRFLLMAAFREMLVNAMEHGAGFDPDKVVEVTAARTARTIVYHFRDPGGGFDRSDLAHAVASPDPESVLAATEHRAEAGKRPGGFGMLLVKHIADELIYNEHGNEVIMIKHLS